MEFRILGPFEVIANGQALDLGGQKQRTLLATLLIEANRVVSAARLIKNVWEDEPPETAQKAVQVYVSHARKLLGRERLETKPAGYVLHVDEGELDVSRFVSLAEGGSYDEALALWRGPALCDFAAHRFAQAEIARLDELRVSCIEARIDRGLVQGRHLSLAGELDSLVREYPLRERLRGQLMLALYRSGRQAEALDACRSGRHLLVEELGLEPGEALKNLERAILSHDPSLDLTEPESAQPRSPQLSDVPAEPRRSQAAVREMRKTVTVLFADVAPESDRLDPELLRRITGRTFDELRDVLELHGGSVERLMRGGLTAIFGTPHVHEDDPLRAVRSAVELRGHLATLNAELERESGVRLGLRIGVSTGEVVTGGIKQGDIVGEAVAVAARLEQAAPLGEILIDARTQRFVRDNVRAEPAAREAGERVFRLLAVVPDAVGRPSRFTSPMIGRQRECRRLHAAFEQAVSDASCQLFTILGAAGVGKSRLVQEFLDQLGNAALTAYGRCLPYGEGITYWPVVEAVKEAAGLDEADSFEQSKQKLVAQLDSLEEAEPVAQRIAELIGLTEAAGGAEEGSWAVRAFFEGFARRRPFVLVFDDIHWGEPSFLELVEQIADRTREVPLLLICIARPELVEVRPGWGGGKLNATAVLLEPLSDEESAELINHLAAGALDPPTRRRVITAAEGNPLYVEEMLALAQEDEGAAGELEVPPTIQALLAARLDRLEHEERSALECAAIEGKVFHQGSIEELSPEELRATLPATLAKLAYKELIRPSGAVFAGERAFRFRHLLIRDAAYDSISKEVRAELHDRHATWLERKVGRRLPEYEEIVGYHLERAFRYRSELGTVDAAAQELARRAAARLGSAGRRAFARSDAAAGVNLISRAAALLPANDPARVELIPNVRVMQGAGGDLRWAEDVLTDAVESGDARLRAHALVQRGFLRLFSDPAVTPEELIELSRRAVVAFEGPSDELGLARAWRLAAQARYLARRGEECAAASEQALVHALRAGDAFEVKEIVEWLAVSLSLGPAPTSTVDRRCDELLRQVGGDRSVEVNLLSIRGYQLAMQGCEAKARDLLGRARAVARDSADPHGLPYHPINVAFVELLFDKPADAALELRSACRVLEDGGEQTNYSSMTALLAVALCAQSEYQEAEAFSRASETAARANDVLANVLWRSTRARARAGMGDLDAAESFARDAVEFAEQSDFLTVHGDALVTLAEILERVGRPEDAASELRNAIVLYEQKGNAVSAAKARSLLERSLS
jgi:DNA-binding SARP family transcriptional activator/class 3 adenylate cyclase/tetratricopeptide (TPR) repeat protein